MRCARCGDEMWLTDLHALLDHLRVMHPDRYEELEWWPDGGLVIKEDLTELAVADVLDKPEGAA